VVLVQQSRDSIFHDEDTSIQLGLLWWSHTPVSILTLKSPLGVIGAICYDSKTLGLVNK